MSELLESVRRSFYHEVLCYRDAESMLEGREGSYLLRESDVKKGIFIISYVKSSSVSHILVPNTKGTYHRQSLEQAVDIAADIKQPPTVIILSPLQVRQALGVRVILVAVILKPAILVPVILRSPGATAAALQLVIRKPFTIIISIFTSCSNARTAVGISKIPRSALTRGNVAEVTTSPSPVQFVDTRQSMTRPLGFIVRCTLPIPSSAGWRIAGGASKLKRASMNTRSFTRSMASSVTSVTRSSDADGRGRGTWSRCIKM